jgi:myosin heavy subunit
MSDLRQSGEKKTAELKKEQSDKTDEIERLKKLVNELKTLNDDLQISKKTMQEKQGSELSDLKSSVNLLEKENEQLRKATAEQSVKIVELENVKNEKKEHLQTQPKKDLLKDINKLKEHYLETIDNWKTKYEDTKMLLNLRDQELLIYKRRGEKKLIGENNDICEEIDTDGKQKGVDTVDDDEK